MMTPEQIIAELTQRFKRQAMQIEALTSLALMTRPAPQIHTKAISRAVAGNVNGYCGLIAFELPVETIGKRYRVELYEL